MLLFLENVANYLADSSTWVYLNLASGKKGLSNWGGGGGVYEGIIGSMWLSSFGSTYFKYLNIGSSRIPGPI